MAAAAAAAAIAAPGAVEEVLHSEISVQFVAFVGAGVGALVVIIGVDDAHSNFAPHTDMTMTRIIMSTMPRITAVSLAFLRHMARFSCAVEWR